MSMHVHDTACRVIQLGRLGYADAWDLQQRLVAARKAGTAPDLLLLCEHPHVLTLMRSCAHALARRARATRTSTCTEHDTVRCA